MNLMGSIEEEKINVTTAPGLSRLLCHSSLTCQLLLGGYATYIPATVSLGRGEKGMAWPPLRSGKWAKAILEVPKKWVGKPHIWAVVLNFLPLPVVG